MKGGVPHVRPPAEVLARMLAVRVHLDDCGGQDGRLRVLPGSHRHGLLKDAGILGWPKEAAFTCAVRRGDAILMRPLLLHASSAAAEPAGRRVIHIEFAADERPHVMLGAQYGDAGFKLPFDPNLGRAVGDPETAFLSRGKMIRPYWREPENRRISAILTLRHYPVGKRRYSRWREEIREQIKTGAIDPDAVPQPDFDFGELGLGVVVWDNAYAEIPLPLDIFRGPYDERWSVVVNDQRLTFRGAGIVAVEPNTEPQSTG